MAWRSTLQLANPSFSKVKKDHHTFGLPPQAQHALEVAVDGVEIGTPEPPEPPSSASFPHPALSNIAEVEGSSARGNASGDASPHPAKDPHNSTGPIDPSPTV